MKPLLFCPSPRNIPEVRKSWYNLKHDKFIVKNKLEYKAYREGRDFFLDHPEYTHLVVCPDDLVIHPESFNILLDDVKKYKYETLSGVANIDESQPNVSCCMDTCIDYSQNRATGKLLQISRLPHVVIEVGHTGFGCQFISRELMGLTSFTGIDKGYFDWKFSQECHRMSIPLMCNPEAQFYHMRTAQYDELHKWLDGEHPENEGYTIHVKY